MTEKVYDTKRVIVQVVGGICTSVSIPEGVVLEIRDYDIEGCDTSDPMLGDFRKDQNGDEYHYYEEEA